MKELFKVLKDHSNGFMQDLVTSSYQHCLISEAQRFLEDPDDIDIEGCGTENVVRVCVVQPSFRSVLSDAIAKIQGAKLILDRFGFDGTTQGTPLGRPIEDGEPRLGDKLTVLINDISIAMKRLDYALYRGTIYRKCEGAVYSYSYRCDVKTFVNSLAANESFKARLLKEMKKVIDLLADPDCEVIRPIIVDYNLIEVNDGYCWSVSERRFLRNAIPADKVGLVTPRAFSPYDPLKVPQPKYFREVLENSLSEADIALFCEDFLRLLHFNKKKHKERVPCLVGEADSGKTSLFYPILGLIHHNNVATVTKQKVFNKAMINKHTEVIFIDEATPSTLDVDDWKILTQGGYTACDVKYRTARSFFNRCPMFMTAQQKLAFNPEDQQAMDRRLRYYYFKSLPNPKKRATQWLLKHPMECIAWAALKARVDGDEDESSDDDEAAERHAHTDEGALPESEKEALRTLQLTDLLLESAERPHHDEKTAQVDDEQDLDDSGDDETVAALKTSLEQSSPGSLRHRHISHILETRLQEKERLKRLEESRYEGYQQHLLSRGVSEENVTLLPRDCTATLPTPIRNDLALFEQEQAKAELEARKKRAKEVFQSSWLKTTERELHECTVNLQTSIQPDMEATMMALSEIIQDKLKNHHRNLGTLGCREALSERKRLCTELGLLRKEDQEMIKSLTEPLPLACTHHTVGDDDELVNYAPSVSAENNSASVPMLFTPPESEKGADNYDEEDDDDYICSSQTPKTPSYFPWSDFPCAPSPNPLARTPRKRPRLTQIPSSSGQKKITSFFLSQGHSRN